MKDWLKVIGYISIIPLLIGLYFFENIRGYYRFQALCDLEKPKQLIGKVEPNQGWYLDYKNGKSVSKWTAFRIASLPNVKYVRFKQIRDNQMHDVHYIGGHTALESSYEISPVDESQSPRYLWRELDEELQNELRTARSGLQIVDLVSNKLMVNFTHIYYGTFDQNKTLLAAPSGNACSWDTYSFMNHTNVEQIFGK